MKSYSHWGMLPVPSIMVVAVKACDLIDRGIMPGHVVYSKSGESLAIIPQTEYQRLNFGPELP